MRISRYDAMSQWELDEGATLMCLPIRFGDCEVNVRFVFLEVASVSISLYSRANDRWWKPQTAHSGLRDLAGNVIRDVIFAQCLHH